MMATMTYLLVLVGFIIGICHLLPHSPPSQSFAACVYTLIGFALAQGALSGAVTALGLGPRGPFHDALEHLTEYDGDRPVVLLVGSSFTQAGIDPEALAEVLSTSGSSVAVLSLAIGGAPHLERLHYLKEYLTRAKRKPQLVLFEVAGGYDSGPLYQLQQMHFTDRMVAMMDGSSAWWAFRWLFSADAISLTQRVILGGDITHIQRVGFDCDSLDTGNRI